MSVEWYFQKDGKEKGPVPSTQLKAFTVEGIVKPHTPVRRVSGSESSAWLRAGEVEGLFPGISRHSLGTPICANCGKVLSDGVCPNCSPSATAPRPNEEADVQIPQQTNNPFSDLIPVRHRNGIGGWLNEDNNGQADTWGIVSCMMGAFSVGFLLTTPVLLLPFATGAAAAGLISAYFSVNNKLKLIGIIVNFILLYVIYIAESKEIEHIVPRFEDYWPFQNSDF